MATVQLNIQDRGRSEDQAEMIVPAFLSFQDFGLGADWSVLGAKQRVLSLMLDVGASAETLVIRRERGLAIADYGQSDDLATLVEAPKPVVSLEIVDVGTSPDLAFLSYTAFIEIVDVGASADTASFAPEIPEVAPPSDGQSAGTVNLVRNPSLEDATVGLTDWTATDPDALTRTSAAEPWVGSYSARYAVAPATGGHEVTIQSIAGLADQRVGGTWVGSVALRGDASFVTLMLALRYTDGTSDLSETVLIDSSAPRPLNDDWWPYATAPVAQDGAKNLSRLDLVVGTSAHGLLERIIRLDGAQIESAWNGGATPYADGDRGEGHRWTGAPHFSPSVREPGA